MSEVQDLSHDIGNMTIYEKLARMQNEMHYIGLKNRRRRLNNNLQ